MPALKALLTVVLEVDAGDAALTNPCLPLLKALPRFFLIRADFGQHRPTVKKDNLRPTTFNRFVEPALTFRKSYRRNKVLLFVSNQVEIVVFLREITERLLQIASRHFAVEVCDLHGSWRAV